MKQPDNERGYYAGWGVAYLLGVGVFLYALWRGNSGNWCAPTADENCFREWVSALGGWAAVAAAVPTIFYLSKQVRDADQHNRNSALIALWGKRATAGRAISRVTGYIELLDQMLEKLHPTKQASDVTLQQILHDLRAICADTAFVSFEKDVACPTNSVEVIVPGIATLEQALQQHTSTRNLVALRVLQTDIRIHFSVIRLYLQEVEHLGSRFIDETQRMI